MTAAFWALYYIADETRLPSELLSALRRSINPSAPIPTTSPCLSAPEHSFKPLREDMQEDFNKSLPLTQLVELRHGYIKLSGSS